MALLPVIGLAQQADPHWHGQHYNVQDGMPSSSILDMAVDTMGFLWLATEGGLISFDGRNFRSVQLIPGHAPLTERMRELFRTADGGLMATEAKGTAYSIHGASMAWKQHRTSNRLKIAGTLPNAGFFATLADTMAASFDPASPVPTYAFLQATDGIWGVVQKNRITRYRGGAVDGHFTLPADASRVFQLDGQSYGFTENLEPFRIGQAMDRAVPVGVHWPAGLTAAAGGGQIFWDPGADEAFLLHERRLYTIKGTDKGDTLIISALDLELPKNARITCIAVPWKDNALAVGTLSKGLFMYHRVAMRSMECTDGAMADQSYYAQLDLGVAGVLALSSDQKGVVLGESGCSLPDEALRTAARTGLAKDAAGWIWTFRRDTTQAFHPTSKEVRKLADGVKAEPVFLVEGDSMWLADHQRLGYVKNFQPHWLHQLNKPVDERPMSINRLPDGRLCYTTCQGLFVASDPSCTQFHPEKRTQGLCIRAVDVLDERAFLGTYGQGAYLWSSSEFRRLPMDRHGSLSHVHATVLDRRGRLWFSTNRGMVSTTLHELLVYFEDTTQAPCYTQYGERAGLTVPEMNGGCSPAWIRCADGRLSFPSMGGVVSFIPEQVPDPFPIHGVTIGNVLVDGHDWPIDEYSIYPASTRRVIIPYAMAFWGDPANAQWEYRITGVQETWLPLDANKTELVLDRPPVGEHEVYIRPVGAKARGLEPELFFWFRVEPAFLTTWLGISLIAGSVLLVALLAWRVRSAQLRAHNLQLEEHVRDRTAELALSLESSATLNAIITHDIVTPLTFIARVARGARGFLPSGQEASPLTETLDDLSNSADKLHDKASDLLTWMKYNTDRIATRTDTADLHLEVARMLEHWSMLAHQEGISLRNDVPEGTMVRTDRRVLGVIVNNLVSNAVVHGGAGADVWIGHEATATGWVLTVQDSGRGIPTAALKAVNELIARPVIGNRPLFLRSDMQSLGFAIVVSLTRSLGGRVQVESGANGTLVSISFPNDPRTPTGDHPGSPSSDMTGTP